MDRDMKKAAENGDVDAFYKSIKEDSDVLTQMKLKDFVQTPLHIAALSGHTKFCLEIMRLMPSLARKPNLNGYTPLQLAMQVITDRKGAMPVNTKKKIAMQAIKPYIGLVKRLVNVDPELARVKGREGMTLLHQAAQIGDADLLVAFFSACPESIKELTIESETALHVAVKNRKFEACQALVGWVSRGFYREITALEDRILNWKDSDGNTVLHIAVSTYQPRVVKLLINSRCLLVNSTNSKNQTAMDILECPENQTSVDIPECEDDQTARDIIECQEDHQTSESQKQLVAEMKATLTKAKARKAIPLSKPLTRKAITAEPRTSVEYIKSKIGIYDNLIISFLTGFGFFSPDSRTGPLVVAVLIATATYHAGLNPPVGFLENKSDNHLTGIARLSIYYYYFYQGFNTTAFLASMGLIFVLLPLGPWYLLLEYSLIACYMLSVIWLSPSRIGMIVLSTGLFSISLSIAACFFIVVYKHRNFSMCRQIIAPDSSEKWQHHTQLHETRSKRFLVSLIAMFIFMLVLLWLLGIGIYANVKSIH